MKRSRFCFVIEIISRKYTYILFKMMEEWLIVFFEMSLINLEYSVISSFLLDNSPNCLFGCVIQLPSFWPENCLTTRRIDINFQSFVSYSKWSNSTSVFLWHDSTQKLKVSQRESRPNCLPPLINWFWRENSNGLLGYCKLAWCDNRERRAAFVSTKRENYGPIHTFPSYSI